MLTTVDGPATPAFHAVKITNAAPMASVMSDGDPEDLRAALDTAATGECVYRGLPFSVNGVVRVGTAPATLEFKPVSARWLVFLHAADRGSLPRDESGFISPMKGAGLLNEPAGTYTVQYVDGSSHTLSLNRRHEISAYAKGWGENTLQGVPQVGPVAIPQHHEQSQRENSWQSSAWGQSQTRVGFHHYMRWLNQLCAWKNPTPDVEITSVVCQAASADLFVFGLSAGTVETNPLRWDRRRKALINLAAMIPEGEKFDPVIGEDGRLSQVRIDLGSIISAMPQRIYPTENWATGHNNLQPELSETHVVVEYTSHPEARLSVVGTEVPVSELIDVQDAENDRLATGVAPSYHRVQIRIVEKGSTVPVPVKLHVHGEAGEYLAPVDRHRIPNHAWFEDYSADFIHMPAGGSTGPNGLPLGPHYCTYIPGETFVDVPIGKLFVEVSKGFEIEPVRSVFDVSPRVDTITIELDRVLRWRDRGWVSADTHVHFLSPATALIEGSAEGVNLINLLASQWGELMTNVGDFDGKTTWGSKEAGGDGEYLVRVGTENRQHVLGHISLLGYEGPIIAPMTTGGPDESAIGDPIEILLTEWARQCKAQNGVVILPHFPNPRLENAAAIVDGSVDGVEMTSWGNLYGGIDPYSLSDWYRYLNCGYNVAAVGGTDKMSASTAVGTSRTYARIPGEAEFSLESWRDAVRAQETFVTYGPLLEFSVGGAPMGGSLNLPPAGGSVDVTWEVASVTVPVTEVDLMINGRIAERKTVTDWAAESGSSRTVSGSWSVKLDSSSWLALLVRGHYPEKQEIIVSHSSAVVAHVEGSEFYVEHDALSILEQIEGTLAYIDTVGTRAETEQFKRIKLVLESVHRTLHNRMHQLGHFHEHTVGEDHTEHH